MFSLHVLLPLAAKGSSNVPNGYRQVDLLSFSREQQQELVCGGMAHCVQYFRQSKCNRQVCGVQEMLIGQLHLKLLMNFHSLTSIRQPRLRV
jgi:hypothetical protein